MIMVRTEINERDLREVYRKNGGDDLMERLSEEYVILLRKYYPLRFLRMVARAEQIRQM
mgnify:CR=1 FL=1